jgi:hypothetical protein
MNIQDEIQKIKRQLAISDDKQDFILLDLFQDWLNTACSICNRLEPVPALVSIVRDITISSYRKRGGEGMTEHTAGGQSYSYENLREELFQRLIQANLRVYRL